MRLLKPFGSDRGEGPGKAQGKASRGSRAMSRGVAQGPAKGTPRRGRRIRLPRPGQLLLGSAGVAAAGMVVLGLYAVQSGWAGRQLERAVATAYGWTAEAGLAVDQVLVAGRKRTQRAELIAALGVAPGAPLLAFDPWRARERLEALPWVRRADVQRHFPGVIFLRLREREPLALWQLDGVLKVIDRSGEEIAGAAPDAFAGLPLVVGQDAPRHAAELLSILASEPDLEAQVTAAVWVGGRRWNVQLNGGIDIQLPESEPGRAWAHLASIDRKHKVLERDVLVIDLRLPDRLIIRTTRELPEGGGPSPGETT